MISGACGRRSIGKVRANRSGSSSQPQAICGVSDDVAQVSITSGSPTKPPGTPRCSSVYPRRRVGLRVDRQRRLRGHDRRVAGRLPSVVERVPDRERHAEVPLPADQPVGAQALHPVLVTDPHEVRVPVQLPPALQQLLAQASVPGAVADVPLPAGDDLQRPVALLVELDRVRDRLRVSPTSVAGLAQQLDHPPPGLHGRSSPPSCCQAPAPAPVSQSGRRACSRPSRRSSERSGRSSSRHQMTSVGSPKVQTIAIPEPLSGSASGCARIGTSHPEHRGADLGAEQRR